jgi:hypothetical protein
MVSNGVLSDFFWISQDTNVGFCCLLCHHLLLSSAKNGEKIRVRSRVMCMLAIIGTWLLLVLDQYKQTNRTTTIKPRGITLPLCKNIIKIITNGYNMKILDNQNPERGYFHIKAKLSMYIVHTVPGRYPLCL